MPVLPDLLRPGLVTVFCGSAASRKAAAVGAYYAGPGNKFWPMLYETGLTDRLWRPQEYPGLLALGIGLTDLAKDHFGADSDLPREADDVAGLVARLEAVRPHLVAFTSRRPASVVFRALFGRPPAATGPQPQTLAGAEVHVLPSPSGLARRWWDPAPWRGLAAAHRRERNFHTRG